jgi:hypothetical protein
VDFRDHTYLAGGTERQRLAYEVASRLNLDEVVTLDEWVVAGTIPIGMDIQTSDLDILASAPSLTDARRDLDRQLGGFPGYRSRETRIRDVPSLIALLEVRGLPVEIFVQRQPVANQHGYRHLIIENRLLTLLGRRFARVVRDLRSSGLKTEPAFAAALDLDGDPYEALLRVETMTDDALVTRWRATGR